MSTITTINERSTRKMRIRFFDFDGRPFTPTYFKYSIHDVQTGATIKPVTEVVPTGSVCDVIITSADNAIINDNLQSELKCFTLEWYLANTLMGTAELIYRVNNLKKVPFA